MLQLTEFSSLNLEKLNNDEFTNFMRGVLALCDTNNLDKIGVLQTDYTEMQQKLDLMTEATRQTRLSMETESITSLDKERNDAMSFLLSAFRFERKNLIKERKEAADALYKLTKNYTGTQNLPLRQKSQIIDGLLTDLKKSANSEYIVTLGLSTAVTGLDKLNKDVQKLIEGRAESQLTNVTINAKKVRKEATKIYKQMLRYVFATHTLHPNAQTESFMLRINKLMDDTSTANKLRFSATNAKASPKATEQPAATSETTMK